VEPVAADLRELFLHLLWGHRSPGLWDVRTEGGVGLVQKGSCTVEVLEASTGEGWPIRAQPQHVKHITCKFRDAGHL
jgi:hypothetical protein